MVFTPENVFPPPCRRLFLDMKRKIHREYNANTTQLLWASSIHYECVILDTKVSQSGSGQNAIKVMELHEKVFEFMKHNYCFGCAPRFKSGKIPERISQSVTLIGFATL